MAEPINLRQARKRKRRDGKEREAAENRILHGRTGAEKARSRLERELGDKRLDDHLRQHPAKSPQDPDK
ncbi:MAG TPA: DUF4169 family protein [Afifellaceae bacterium]|nr:DUF4169 family protein [Afifellaceae bacterium]